MSYHWINVATPLSFVFSEDSMLDSVLKDLEPLKGSEYSKGVKRFVNFKFNAFQSISSNSVLLIIGDGPFYKLEDVDSISSFDRGANNYMVEFIKGIGR